jgi:flagellar assembly protein FliH
VTACMQRYLFDRSFELTANGRAIQEAPTLPVFSTEDLEAARAEGVAAGRAEALDMMRAREDFEGRVVDALDRLNAALNRLLEDTHRAHAQTQCNALMVASAICRKLLPRLYGESGCREVEDVVSSVLRGLPAHTEVRIRLAPDLLAPLSTRLQQTAGALIEAGTLAVTGDPALAPGDCRIEWAGGGVLREQRLLWQEIDALIDDVLPAEAPPPERLAATTEPTGGTDA